MALNVLYLKSVVMLLLLFHLPMMLFAVFDLVIADVLSIRKEMSKIQN